MAIAADRRPGPAQLPLLGELRRARLAVPAPAPGAPGAPAPGAPGAGAAYRRRLADLTDAALAELWRHAAATTGLDLGHGVALAAVGSLGRRDGGPAADLDLVLVHDGRLPAADLARLADALWYPLWDARLDLDHAVRTLDECRRVASADLPAAVGLLHLRTVAGDPAVGERAQEAVLADWRSGARRRLPDLLDSVVRRAERFGEVAYLLEPDLKEARGGLRDAVVVDALVASWLAERPRGRLDVGRAHAHLLDVRDALALSTGRATNRLVLPEQDEVARRCGFAGGDGDAADDLLASVAGAARVITAALDTTVRRARQNNEARRPRLLRPLLVRGRAAPPRLPAVAEGLVEHEGEIVLAAGADPAADPQLALRAAAAAARTGLPLSPAMLDSLGRTAPLPEPWPRGALGLLLELLAAGPAQVPVWEALDLAGVVTVWFPEWAAVRNRPQRNALHRFTVDRHLVETVAGVPATADVTLPGGVTLPADVTLPGGVSVAGEHVLLLAALLHDIGKTPGAHDHAARGAAVVPGILDRLGVSAGERDDVVLLVREHLLLPAVATTRDVADPAVLAEVADAVARRPDLLLLLRRLTEADARAAGPQAWTAWRAQLVTTLTDRVAAALRALP
ncbi:HD domain-containing protein [Georgenia daeguensis]|uniref:Bifunctional uridylyltransferase/uridylyl-removing enzyme n=1 Tax=Georgenia daeguensis TaxID=908355 RepID=A0ABP8ERS6_9MICO